MGYSVRVLELALHYPTAYTRYIRYIPHTIIFNPGILVSLVSARQATRPSTRSTVIRTD